MVISYWDMAASFITAGVLQEELFLQCSSELLVVWERICDLVPHLRQTYKIPYVAKNVETVANSFVRWMNSQSSEAYSAFSAMVRAR